MALGSVTYGIGGYDPGHANGNVIERLVDNGDGTGTRTTYDAAGEVAAVVELTGLPVVLEVDLTAEIAAARASLAAATTVAQVRSRTIALLDLLTP